MTKYKIVLAELSEGLWRSGTFCRHSAVEPLGIEYVGAAALRVGHAVKIIQQRDRSDDEVLGEIEEFRPDIVGFSAFTYNFPASQKMAAELKRRNPHVITVFGGYHPTAKPEVVQDEGVDFAVLGEGEQPFLELLDGLQHKRSLNDIRGIAFSNERLHINPRAPRCDDLDSLPLPLRSEALLDACGIESLILPPASKQKSVALVSYARGCPFDCAFCCSPGHLGRRVIYRSPESVVAEVRHLQAEFGTNLVFFADLNFNTSKRRVLALCRSILKAKVKINWYVMCRVDNVDAELLKYMAEAGCSKIAYGVDAINPASLRRMKPGQRVDVDMMKRTLELTHRSPIFTRAFLIIGYPWETKADLADVASAVRSMPIEDLRVGILTPLPGSAIYDEFKKDGLLLHEDFSKYTTEECVVNLDHMTSEELYTMRDDLFKGFYRTESYDRRMEEKIARYPQLGQSYAEFRQFLQRKGVL